LVWSVRMAPITRSSIQSASCGEPKSRESYANTGGPGTAAKIRNR
jgi:hypothetical protein